MVVQEGIMTDTTSKENLSKEKIREIIAKRAAKEFKEGDVVTLGIGLPTEVTKYLPENMNVMFQSENGLLGVGKDQTGENTDPRVINAGGGLVETKQGACFYDSQMAFIMMRGGHIDATVLGALQADSEGNLANWSVPGKFTPGMGGAMDLVVGAKKVIVVMEHTSKGVSKIVERCDLPLTASREVNLIITERCVFRVDLGQKADNACVLNTDTNEFSVNTGTTGGLILEEINPMFSIEDIKACTGATFRVSENLKEMEI